MAATKTDTNAKTAGQRASLSHFRQSPRKVRLVADAVRGKQVPEARALLRFLDVKSAPAIKKLIESAAANVRSNGGDPDRMQIKTITVDEGIKMRRVMPMARGRANIYHKRTSRITIELAEAAQKEQQKAQAKTQSTKQQETTTKAKRTTAKK